MSEIPSEDDISLKAVLRGAVSANPMRGLEHLFGINTVGTEFGELGHHFGTVFGIRHTEPLRSGVEHLASGLSLADKVVDHEGNKEFALEILHVFRIRKEGLEELVGVSEVVGGEAPEIHGHGRGVGNRYPLVVLIEILHRAVVPFDLGAFHDRSQMVLLVDFTHATAHCTAVREGVAHAEAHHRIAAGAAFGERGEEFTHDLESIAIVEIVAVEHGEGFFDHVLSHHHGVVRTPGLLAVGGAGETFGECVERLEDEFAGNLVLVFGEDDLAEIVFEVFADNKHELTEAGVDGVVDRVVHDGLSLGAERVELFEATIAAAHTGSEQEKSGFHDE